MHPNNEKVETSTPDFTRERREQLRALFPEAWTEDSIDFEKLRAALGDLSDERSERYLFSWAGKRESLQLLQTPSQATLHPAPDESLNWDETQNLFIEGDNLEALKLLYKPLFGRVKMIYIDPPYNTGNDFIYPDNFADPLKNYLIQTGQKDANGDLQTSSPDTNGHIHSRWLSMMYPRLFLARQLLKDDGVIFVSIDDYEVHHLRLLMNEVFGAENFIAQLVWEKGRKNDAKLFSTGHEYMLVFARSVATLKELKTIWREAKPGAKEILEKCRNLFAQEQSTEESVQVALREWYSSLPNSHPSKKLSRYKNIDKYSPKNGPWRDRDISWPGGGGPRYDVIHPVTKQPCKVPEAGWRYSTPESMAGQIKLGLVEFREDHTQPPFLKAHLIPVAEELDDELEGAEDESVPEYEEDENGEEELVGMQVMSSVIYKQSQVAVKYLRKLMGEKIFDNPKDHEVIMRLVRYCTSPSSKDIVLDFFSGSSSTAEAVLQANKEDNGNRRFVCIQLPETTRKLKQNGTYKETLASRAGYKTIADIGKERIRRVVALMKKSEEGNLEFSLPDDLGFKVWKLGESNFRQWQKVQEGDSKGYLEQLELMNDALLPESNPQSVLYEVALREGFGLNARIEPLPGDVSVWQVSDPEKDQSFFISLERNIELESLRPLNLKADDLFICRGIAVDDTTVANLALQCRLKMI